MEFVGFPDIEGFHNVVKYTEAFPAEAVKVPYRSKIKLHGSNAGIRVQDGQVGAQSRTQQLEPGKADLAGFAAWVSANKGFWQYLPNCTVFGEWCGPGVVKGRGTAISKISEKIFAIFAAVLDDGLQFVADPDAIERMLPAGGLARVHILPWHGDVFHIDYADRAGLEPAAAKLNEELAKIEKLDPWVNSVFGVQGEAEGFVCYPDALSVATFANLAFKVKAEKHRVQVQKEAVQVDPAVVAGIEDFVQMFVTPQRLEQGLAAIGEVSMPKIAQYIQWVVGDVRKESTAELEAAKLSWAQVQSQVAQAARVWYLAKCREGREAATVS